MNATRISNPEYPSIHVEPVSDRQMVRLVSRRGDVATALLHGMGWTVMFGAMAFQVTSLDCALAALDWLPNPNQGEGSRP